MLGSAWAFAAAVLIIVIWLVTGPVFHFSAARVNLPRMKLFRAKPTVRGAPSNGTTSTSVVILMVNLRKK